MRFFTAHVQFRPYYYFRFKSDVIFELSTPFFRFGHFVGATPFSATFVTILRMRSKYPNLLSLANLSPEMDSASQIFY